MSKKQSPWQVFYISGKKRRELDIVCAEDELTPGEKAKVYVREMSHWTTG